MSGPATVVLPVNTGTGLRYLLTAPSYPPVPIAIGIAVLRYRLFEIDRIISRTVSWALLTGILVALFAAVDLAALQAALLATAGEAVRPVSAAVLLPAGAEVAR